MSPTPGRRELLPLLDRLCDGRLDDEGHARLQLLLKDDPDAQRMYLDYLDLHLAIGRRVRPATAPARADAGSPTRDRKAPTAVPFARRLWLPALLTLGVAAAMV